MTDRNIVLIDPNDRRSVAALLLSAEAHTWGKVVSRETGEIGWAVPSQRFIGLYHLATADSCTCTDNRLGQVCKHQRAVRIHELLAHAVQRPRRRRLHLRPVPNEEETYD